MTTSQIWHMGSSAWRIRTNINGNPRNTGAEMLVQWQDDQLAAQRRRLSFGRAASLAQLVKVGQIHTRVDLAQLSQMAPRGLVQRCLEVWRESRVLRSLSKLPEANLTSASWLAIAATCTSILGAGQPGCPVPEAAGPDRSADITQTPNRC